MLHVSSPTALCCMREQFRVSDDYGRCELGGTNRCGTLRMSNIGAERQMGLAPPLSTSPLCSRLGAQRRDLRLYRERSICARIETWSFPPASSHFGLGTRRL